MDSFTIFGVPIGWFLLFVLMAVNTVCFINRIGPYKP